MKLVIWLAAFFIMLAFRKEMFAREARKLSIDELNGSARKALRAGQPTRSNHAGKAFLSLFSSVRYGTLIADKYD
jgi:hypothetical protein